MTTDVFQALANALNTWHSALENYSLVQLTKAPDYNKWSVGQLYLHLVEETSWYLKQAESAIGGGNDAEAEMGEVLQGWFRKNSFPDRKFAGLAGPQSVPQPRSRQQIEEGLVRLRQNLGILETKLKQKGSVGKAAHPEHGYLSAEEWLQYAKMHFRHHLRQKDQLDNYLFGG
ncbi:MAG: hypothetical protein WBB45_12070 [Cyclobacteriaceae bacterium]